MNEVAHYKFDVQGYLILPDVLNQDEVAELNRLVDAQNLAEPGLESNDARIGGYLSWGQPFCELLDAAAIKT
ncbi:MAG: hypothetical protein KDE54_02530, partial [Caldilineaceae bacterium]|nr:hypothetical protein [Caldilineaceae bacterium]